MIPAAITIDNCTWEFDGVSPDLEASALTAIQLTVASAKEGTEEALREIEAVRQLIAADPERLILVERVEDLENAARKKRTGIILHFQNTRPFGDELGRVGSFRRLGLRVVQLTYNERNYAADGCLESSDAGLSNFGRSLVEEINNQGLVLDLTHVGRRSSLEAVDASRHPCVFSHSNPRKRADNPRNISDEQIRACADRGGVIGICGWGPISWDGSNSPPSLNSIADHLDYVADLVGPAHLAIATDAPASGNTDRILAHLLDINEAYGDVTGAFVRTFGNGLEHRYPVPLRRLPELADLLRERGWDEVSVRGAMGENMVRIYREVWAERRPS